MTQGSAPAPAPAAEPMQTDKPADAPKAARPITLVNDSGKYELIAVLTHKGRSADSGHYIAWVKQEDGKPAIYWLIY